jgi:hypothetical protein
LPTFTAQQRLFTEQQAREIRGTLARAEAELAGAEAEVTAAESEFNEADRVINEPVQRRDRAWTRLVSARRIHGRLKDTTFQSRQMLARLEEELNK